MSNFTIVEVIKAFLNKEGLVLCKAADTKLAIDGLYEREALNEIIEVIDDAREWSSVENTTPIPKDVLAALTEASA